MFWISLFNYPSTYLFFSFVYANLVKISTIAIYSSIGIKKVKKEWKNNSNPTFNYAEKKNIYAHSLAIGTDGVPINNQGSDHLWRPRSLAPQPNSCTSKYDE